MTIHVIGAGVSGLLAARELSLAGASVSVIDNTAPGAASWAGAGVLSPLHPWRYPEPVNALSEWGQENYRTLAEQLMATTGIDVEWEQSGMVVVDPHSMGAAQAWCRIRPGSRFIEGEELRELEPRLGRFNAAWWLPHVAQVRNPRLLAALKQDLAGRGVSTRHDTVTEIVVQNGRVTGLTFQNVTIPAHCVVNAAGAWSSHVPLSGAFSPAITPVKGQIVLLKGTRRMLRHLMVNEDCYLVPRRDGRILVGSTVERVGFDARATDDARKRLYVAAVDFVPALSETVIEAQWAGLRPGSPDDVPLIGAHPQIQGLYLSIGHYRNGLTMAPASARLIADIILGRPPILDPAPYAPGRFVVP